jgi:hypothetical protein
MLPSDDGGGLRYANPPYEPRETRQCPAILISCLTA